jgi:sugar O-acyltransferase (sialic acid O-acetyltransferase NeuD family)
MEIVIVGAGGFAREMHCLLPGFLPDEDYSFKGFLGQDQGTPADTDISKLILGDPASYQPQPNERFVLAIGNMDARRRTVEALTSKGGEFLTLVHPTAIVAPTAKLAQGTIIYPLAAVSNNAQLQTCVKLNYYASVGHDTTLGKYCLLAPYATVNGFGVLEDQVYMSTHSTVAPQVRIGKESKISANSAAMKDVPSGSLVFGVPGRVVRRVGT